MNGAIGGTLSSGGFKVSMSIQDGDDEGSIALCTRPSLLQRAREQMSAAFACTWNRRMLWPSQFIRA